MFVRVNDGASISVTQVTPDQTDYRFTWNLGSYGIQENTSSAWINPYTRGMTNATVTASSGVSKSFQIVAYENLGNIALSATGTELNIGDTADVTVSLRVDSSTYTNPTGLYTLTSSDPKVVAIRDNQLFAVGEGTADITAVTITGTEARRPVTVTVSGENLQTLTLPSNIYVVKAEAFAGTAATKLVVPYISDGYYDEWATWIDRPGWRICSRAFADSALKVVEFVWTKEEWFTIVDDAFEGCGTLIFISNQYCHYLDEYASRHGFIYIVK